MAGRSVNRVALLGHLGQDSETKFTQAGVARTTFSVATNRSIKDRESGELREETDWHNCVFWRAEGVAQYLMRGKRVYLEGRLQTRSYEDAAGAKRHATEVVVEELILLGGGDEGKQAATKPKPKEEEEFVATDDDIPF